MRYFDYFKNELGYPEIQTPGPLAAVAEAEGRALDDAAEKGLVLRDQFWPERVGPAALDIHGRGRGVFRHPQETEAQFRTRVVHAFDWAMMAGRYQGLYKIFRAYGYQLDKLVELDGDKWAEFDLEIFSGESLTPETWELMYWLANEYKRASARLRTMRVIKRLSARVEARVALVMGDRLTVWPPPKPKTPAARAGFGVATVTHETWTVYPPPPRPKSPAARAGFGVAVMMTDRWTISVKVTQ